MFSESHMSQIKRLYLLPYNRRWVDVVIFNIVAHLIPKFDINFNQLKKFVKLRIVEFFQTIM